jgi:hypothetical protein
MDDIEEYREEVEAFLTAVETSGPSILRSFDSIIETLAAVNAMLEPSDSAKQTLARLAGEGAERQ